jgi:hypothetical protein
MRKRVHEANSHEHHSRTPDRLLIGRRQVLWQFLTEINVMDNLLAGGE